MPKVGQPLAPPDYLTDLIEVQTTSAPLDSTVPFDPSIEANFGGFTGKQADGSGRATTIQHQATATIPVYNYMGEDRQVAVGDLEIVLDRNLAAPRRLYLRCPRCVSLPNGGIHATFGPNSCPGTAVQKYMTCPICASRGISKRVYESVSLPDNVVADLDDPNYVEADLPSESNHKDRLRELLGSHMTAFHATEAQQLYGVRREINGTGFRNVWGRE